MTQHDDGLSRRRWTWTVAWTAQPQQNRPTLRRGPMSFTPHSGIVIDAPPPPRKGSDLQHILMAFLADVGIIGDEGAREASAIESALAKLYVRTPDQLMKALDLPEVSEHVTRCLGLLLPAVRKHLADNTSRGFPSPVQVQDKPLNKPLCRTLEVARVDVTHIAEIDQVNQSFYARVLLILRIAGGAADPDLTADFAGFPFGQDGQPTLRPSAQWYLDQIDFANAKNLRKVISKVTRAGADLQLIQRVEGDFFERFELQMFPFDEQDLTVTVTCNCALEGPVPVKFHVPTSPVPQLGVDTENFSHSDSWVISPSVLATLSTVGSSHRRFPAVHLSVNVRRQAHFVLLNAALPVSVLSFLSLTAFFVRPEPEFVGDRLTLSTTLLLTAVAFKYTTSQMVPQVSYNTLMDKYSMLGSFVIVAGCLTHTVLGFLGGWVGVSDDILQLSNKICCVLILLLWIGTQTWFVYKAKNARKKKSFLQEMSEKALCGCD